MRREQDRRAPTTPICASACGKFILVGEHAVVYGRPAIAVPLRALRATARVTALPPDSPSVIEAQDLNRLFHIDEPSPDATCEALQVTVRNTLSALGGSEVVPPFHLALCSSVPIASGMGSGAAVATAIVRALAAWLGVALSRHQVSDLVFRTECLLHGSPSGLDNTVIAYEKPVFYCPGQPPEVLAVGAALHWVIGDTGIRSPTRDVVAEVQRSWQAARIQYDAIFDGIASIVLEARQALAAGQAAELGRLLNANQTFLTTLGVSCDALDRLVAAAGSAGALGAKLSGGGRGGIMIALVEANGEDAVEEALRRAGAVRTLHTTLDASPLTPGRKRGDGL